MSTDRDSLSGEDQKRRDEEAVGLRRRIQRAEYLIQRAEDIIRKRESEIHDLQVRRDALRAEIEEARRELDYHLDIVPNCCDMHGRNCEPPSELCCEDCTEAAHDTFPIQHADGSVCVLT